MRVQATCGVELNRFSSPAIDKFRARTRAGSNAIFVLG